MKHQLALCAVISALAVAPACAGTGGPFEGSFSWFEVIDRGSPSEYTNSFSYTLLQRGNYVCGSWSTSSGPHAKESKGLIAGRVRGNLLIANECGDPEDNPGQDFQCTAPSRNATSGDLVSTFRLLRGRLELLGGSSGKEPQMILHRTSDPVRGPDRRWGFGEPLPKFLLECEQAP